ncbi:regulator of sigma subunit-histidine kinase [Chlamydia felis Fe/C-56]|uniref:Regulator of sigma subunit-histidine kinase n=1 Tax=Chlamydia felis (strain Fe/C-56) TaxID=264202 RepID=Q252T1_CHLFF|nr:anti-sigma regulatory factor [Chlamydia felis]BAE81707.1 regulator of sigma subunit-histidine kinase [Chlamydia felis Fe/C-56]
MTSSDGEAVFPALLSELHNMLNFVKGTGQLQTFPREKLLKLELACEELLVNIISYAYQETKSPGTIVICCNGNKEALQVTIKDNGPSFNPLTAPIDLQDQLPLDERKLGGLGIFLAKNSVDEFLYERHGDSNIVHLKIHNN